jgi:hypothetical protein
MSCFSVTYIFSVFDQTNECINAVHLEQCSFYICVKLNYADNTCALPIDENNVIQHYLIVIIIWELIMRYEISTYGKIFSTLS